MVQPADRPAGRDGLRVQAEINFNVRPQLTNPIVPSQAHNSAAPSQTHESSLGHFKPLALPAYTTRKTMQIPIKALADDQEEGDERLTFVVDRIVDADGDHLEFWGPGPRQVWYSIRIEEGG